MHRRMFSPQIVESDEFLEMPPSSQSLYFHLAMKADDDGFVQPKSVMKTTGSGEDDLKVLLLKRFVLPFESGVVVIKHWLIHNLIRPDRYKETRFLEEKSRLFIKENKAYTDNKDNGKPLLKSGCQNDNQPAPQVRIGKDRIGKDSISGELTPSQVMKLFLEDDSYFNKVADFLAEKIRLDKVVILQELKSFKSYWSELNKSGLKQRWEMEKTFELNRRLTTWFNNIKKFNKQKTIQSL